MSINSIISKHDIRTVIISLIMICFGIIAFYPVLSFCPVLVSVFQQQDREQNRRQALKRFTSVALQSVKVQNSNNLVGYRVNAVLVRTNSS